MSKFDKADLEWMGKVIKPTMAKLLDEPEFTPENANGFGCLHYGNEDTQSRWHSPA